MSLNIRIANMYGTFIYLIDTSLIKKNSEEKDKILLIFQTSMCVCYNDIIIAKSRTIIYPGKQLNTYVDCISSLSNILTKCIKIHVSNDEG
jgi:hypothetical protein